MSCTVIFESKDTDTIEDLDWIRSTSGAWGKPNYSLVITDICEEC